MHNCCSAVVRRCKSLAFSGVSGSGCQGPPTTMLTGPFFCVTGDEAAGEVEEPNGLDVGPGDRDEPGFFPDAIARGCDGSIEAVISGLSGGGGSTGGVALEYRCESLSMLPRAFFRVLL